MSSENVKFSNPDNLPVESLTLSVADAGVVRQVNALDSYWVEQRELTVYERPPSGAGLVIGAVEAWKTQIVAYLEDVKWLLSLEYHRFWSTVLFHPQCMDSMVSFLQEASPPYLPPHDSRDVQSLYEDVRKHVLIVFSRLATNKESKSQWMTKEYMADILYNKFIFTMPIIWDICITYGVGNSRHVSRLLGSVFAIQPRYEGDATAAIAFVQEAFKFITVQVNNNYDAIDPPNLPETFRGFGEIRREAAKAAETLSLPVLSDLIVHLLDTAMTLRLFVELWPKAVEIMRKTNFIISIVQLYEHGVPSLYEKLRDASEASVCVSALERQLLAARAELVGLLREVLAKCKCDVLSGQGDVQSHVEEYLSVVMDVLSERLLVRDYQACHPLHEDIDMLREACPDIDTVKTDFILQAIYSNLDEPIPESTTGPPQPQIITNGHATTDDSQTQTATIDNEIPDNVREESLISEVKDILPDLGDGFILKCLKHYGFNAERVINSILEDNLAEPLRELDRSLPIIPVDILDRKYLETGIQRLNVFDGDRFDIMTRDDVDTSRMHVGKRRENLRAVLEDKTHVRQMADIYSKYNLVCDEENMYSDEYDDTYDSDGVAPNADADAEAELGRPFVTPRALLPRGGRGEIQEESEEEVETDVPGGPSGSNGLSGPGGFSGPGGSNNYNKLDFCVNPEEMRARREASFQARRGRGHRPPPLPRSADVVGKARGQGQEKEVVVNRDRKEKHKSTRGNHSRRQGATWKRSQGMVPS